MIKEICHELGSLCRYSQQTIVFSLVVALIMLFSAILAFWGAGQGNYIEQMRLFTAAFEAAPATVVCGTAAALLCDIMSRSYPPNQK